MTSLIRSERQLQGLVKTAAEQLGWMAYHTYDSRKSDAGFPDLTMLRKGRLVVAELKMPGYTLRDEQKLWLLEFAMAGAEAFHWTVNDWTDGTIENVLR